MRPITLCMPYYLNSGMLREHYRRIKGLPTVIRDNLEVLIVDDGSPELPAWGEELGCALSVYRISVDVRWNQDAARNIAAHHAKTQWLLLTDIDHLVPRQTLERIMAGPLEKHRVYRFGRVSAPLLDPYKPHPNSWFMTKGTYEKIGGYDERFAGLYGTDAEFRDRVNQHATTIMLKEVLIRVPREVIADASTTTYLRKQPQDHEGIPRIKAQRALNPNWIPERLTFPYELVWSNRAAR